MEKFDFSGWATKANIRCSDGLTIMKDAFKNNDGKVVTLIVLSTKILNRAEMQNPL